MVIDINFNEPNFAIKYNSKMKGFLIIFLILMTSISSNSQTKLFLTANGVTKSATLVDNKATTELISLLKEGPISLTMTENGGFEKVGNLPQSLPTSDVRQTAHSGDIMLYVGNVLCIFFGSNTWAYTKLGTLDNMTSSEIKQFLSGNPVTVSLSLDDKATVKQVKVSDFTKEEVYDLQGKLITGRPLIAGIYIINGKKTLIR